MTTDLKAANYVLFNSYDFQKPEVVRGIIRGLFGSGAFCCIIWRILMMTLLLFLIGLLSVEGDQHRHQVRVFFFSKFVHEPLSNTTSSARFWSVMLGELLGC